MALGYPDPLTGEERWLFIDARAEVGGWAKILDETVHSYGTAPADRRSLRKRIGAVADARTARRVVIFGVGAIGSAVALALARCGVGTVDLFDSDCLRPGNVIRHAAPLFVIGRTKARAAGFTISLYAPDVKVNPSGTTWDVSEIDRTIRSADLVIDAAATDAFTLLLAERCIEADRPLLMVAAQRAAQVGRVRLFRPRRDPCPQCYRDPAADEAINPAVPRLATEETFLETGCGSATTVSSPVDLEATAVAAAQLGVRLLDGRAEDINQIWVVNEAVAGAPSPLDERGINYRAHAPLRTCSLCGSE